LRGLARDRVHAVALRLIDRGVFRVGGEEYAEENGTRGVATLLRDQVHVSGDVLRFDYIAKHGIQRKVQIVDPPAAVAVRSLMRSRSDSDRLLVYRDRTGYRELHADEINLRLRELAEMECSAKDIRTWQGTVLAAAAFWSVDLPTSKTGFKRTESQVMKGVAEALGNTPGVAPGLLTWLRNGCAVVYPGGVWCCSAG